MHIPCSFGKRHDQSGGQSGGGAARVVSLDSPGDPDEVMTSIPRPDALSPLEHDLTAPVPSQADWELAVTQMIRELHDAGSLDDGTPWVLDRWIDSQRAVWERRLDQAVEPRRMITARLIAVDEENLRRENRQLHDLYKKLSEIRAVRDRLRAEALGVEGHGALSAVGDPVSLGPDPIVELPPLPAGTLGDILHRVRPGGPVRP